METVVVKLYRRRGTNDTFCINNNTRICEFNFKDDDIKVSIGIGRKTLVKDAVPIFKQPSEASSKRKPPVNRLPKILNLDTSDNTITSDEPMISEAEQLRKEMENLKLINDSLQEEIQTLKTQQIKLFKQLRNEIPATLHGSINQIWTVACLLCNFMAPLIQKDTDQ